ncbi:hypothetical protein BRARA_C00401 [Brassica rapa]|uniref:Elicitor peptide 4 n=2 Tax=Brassica TaxID=3705 RepID=A0A397ZT99_BRACM|nr:elicitor peptide 4 [Brassica rapa]XP_013681789.1 elicitor peptide 4-like [Brassica napus]XP_048625259.1 elicitor peptide 4-like [Brassica napus]XP_048627787.1 elicitor peptide 4-like [Brassica napus]KAH0853158.1 hypothetical protein HID58_090708 [Brassica napus]KAH0853318.1 hypothetical protein HID58_093300 [Brassica napus]KAH0931319.1 hypothetical protein HID58_008436 [Brassica napus]RID68228.1 hypothetical protein BRARA_C00401 [Brassica rapa]CAF2119108.1 unnamed protein product [Brassi
MEREGRREDGVSYYLWIPFKFIHQTLRSLVLKLFGRSPSHHTACLEEEEVEIVQVTSRGLPRKPPKKLQQKPRDSSGKPGRINKKPR